MSDEPQMPPWSQQGYDSEEADAITAHTRKEPVMEATETYPCKIDGCENTTRVHLGPYAYLCGDHQAEAAERLAARRESRTRTARAALASNGAAPDLLREVLRKTEQLEQLQAELDDLKVRIAKEWAR